MKKPSTDTQTTGSTQPDNTKRPLAKHPFVVPVVTFLGLFLVTAVVFVLMGAQTIGPSDKRVVQLYIDGELQTIPTRAQNVQELLNASGIKTSEQDIIEPAVSTPIDSENFTVNVYKARAITVVDPENSEELSTVSAHQEPKDVAKQAGLELFPEDRATLTPPDDLFEDGLDERIVVDRATLTYVNLYGTKIPVRTHVKTVGALLKEKNIVAQTGDQISPAPDTPITPNAQVFVIRTGKKIETKKEKIAAPEKIINDGNLAIGTNEVKEPGKPGERLVTYELELRNGKVYKKKILQKVISIKPETRVILRGTKVPTVAIGGNKAEILAAAGVPTSQHFAADFILAHESGWRLNAQNAGGCLGLGQACPGSKLIAACPAWQTDAICQIQFFTGYANGRYGSWSGAYQAWQIQGWW